MSAVDLSYVVERCRLALVADSRTSGRFDRPLADAEIARIENRLNRLSQAVRDAVDEAIRLEIGDCRLGCGWQSPWRGGDSGDLGASIADHHARLCPNLGESS